MYTDRQVIRAEAIEHFIASHCDGMPERIRDEHGHEWAILPHPCGANGARVLMAECSAFLLCGLFSRNRENDTAGIVVVVDEITFASCGPMASEWIARRGEWCEQ